MGSADQASDQVAALIQTYGRLIRAAVARVSGRKDEDLGDEIVQRVSAAIWKHLDGAQTIDHPASYLYRCAIRETIRELRRELASDDPDLMMSAATADGAGPEHGARARELAQTAFAAAGHDHAGTYLPVGATLACTGTQKVTAINPTTGSITCAADADTNTTYSAGLGLLQSGTTFSVMFGGTGAATTVARADHSHAGTYLPLGPALTCPVGQKVTALNPTTGSVTCAVDTDTTYSAGAGLLLAGTSFAVSYQGTGGSFGVANAAARGDHGHATTACPVNYTSFSRTAGGGATVLCVRAIAPATAVNWTTASRLCLNDTGARLCTYEQIIQVRAINSAFSLTANYWLGDRMGDNTAYVTNASGTTDDFDTVGTVTDTKTGLYCCHERRWW